ncbi:splicing factor, arginine/serine-rich 15 isoform A [Alligator mississippiensis]|uniref:Splicing factor, arginine/serine-rich 15 isoform A n=1 Tax=Alligator mississippiensis TaxID=8496 RepID=A0A151ME15_ALLMI|nr:splicing factor, arginine/serine-rich 15 isoform A [Alligator mississippiensis]
MEAVNAFNQELFSLMEMKPPISRAKMILITKAAIKAIKLYKHVVQIVEKFIKKCKPEYKVPGLYVIDSIVRQSRHQFGTDKDVFGPRFSKNITATFQYLYLCPSEDKSKIVRVLNLWQKNGVFKIEIIQPLLDMAAGTSSTAPMAENTSNNEGSPPPPAKVPSEPPQVTANSVPTVPQLPSSDAFAAVAQLFQTTQGQQLQQILQTFQQPPKPQSPVIDNTVMAHVQAITAQLKTTATQPPEQKAAFPPPEQKTSFDKLLDRFDYDDEPEAVDDSKKEDTAPSPSISQPAFGFPGEGMPPPVYPQLPNIDPFQQRMMGMQQDPIRHQVPLPPNGQMPSFGLLPTPQFPPMAQPVIPPTPPVQQTFQTPFPVQSEPPHMQKTHQQEMEVEQPPVQEGKRHVSDNRKSRSRSASRRRHSPKSRSQERRERERERERRSKGLPQIKPETVSVCSTTLWVGQLDKRTTQQDVGSLLEEFGPIESINMIPPRGCAYIVMVHRQDAYRALQKLSRGNFKVNQKSIKIAWALNKGIKPDYKQYWDVELGVTYIPWDKVKPEDLESFCEGGMLDNETLSPEWKGIPKKSENEVAQNGGAETTHTEPVSPIPKALPVPIPVPMPAPITVPPPQVPPHPSGPPVVGALQPPAFTAPMGIPPPGFAPGVPPPPPPPFLRPGFNPMHLPPGFLPPGPPPPITPPVSVPVSVPHTPPVNIPNSTATGVSEDTTKDASVGNPIPTVVSGSRGNSETSDSSKMYATVPPPVAPTNVPAPASQPMPAPVSQPVPLLGTQGVAPPPAPVVGLQTPSTGLLGARPGLIPLQRPPGIPPPPLQRFPLMPPRHMPPHMLHRGPPPGPGGFGMPPPHGMKNPFPPPGPFVRPGGGMSGSGGSGGPEDNRDGRQFRNDRQTFGSNRDQERYGRRSFGNRVENDRERYGNRNDDRDHERLGNRERREWGRRSPERDRHRDLEDRNRRSSGHRDRERDSRDRESRRDKEENRGKEKPELTDRADGDNNHESHSGKVENADIVSELTTGASEPTGVKPNEVLTSEATSSVEQAAKDIGSVVEAPR